jgi:hypothetical protein
MRTTVLQVVRSNIYRRLKESYCSHLSTVKMGAAVTDISDDPMHHNMRRHIPNNNHLQSPHRETRAAPTKPDRSTHWGTLYDNALQQNDTKPK